MVSSLDLLYCKGMGSRRDFSYKWRMKASSYPPHCSLTQQICFVSVAMLLSTNHLVGSLQKASSQAGRYR